MQDKETSFLRVRDLYTRPIQQGERVESESNKKGQSELKEEI
jgi:hypothetical protein